MRRHLNLYFIFFCANINERGLNSNSIERNPSTGYQTSTTEGYQSMLWMNQSSHRVPPDELTQTYYQYNQLCGDSCVLKEFQLSHEPCCEQCSCDLDICNQNIMQSTCCPDLMNKIDSYPNYFQKCIHPLVLPWKHDLPLREGILMVAACPNGMSGDIVDKCAKDYSGIEYKTPYSVTDLSTNITTTFRNKHCAKCWHNSHVVENAIRWNLAVICSKSQLDIETFDVDLLTRAVSKTTDCTLTFTPPFVLSSNVLCGQGVSECNITGKWRKYEKTTDTFCQAFRAPFRNIYRNLFCYICNTKDEITGDTFSHCENDQSVNESFVMVTNSLVFIKEVNDASDLDNDRCRKGEILDQVQDKCLSVQCRFYKVFDGVTNKCKTLVEALGGVEFNISMKFIPMRHNCSLQESTILYKQNIHEFVLELFAMNEERIVSDIHIDYIPGNNTRCGSKSFKELILNGVDYFLAKIKMRFYVEEQYLTMKKPSDIEDIIKLYHTREIKLLEFDDFVDPIDLTVIFDGQSESYLNDDNGENDVTTRVLHATVVCPLVLLDHVFYNISYDKHGILISPFYLHTFEFIFDEDTNQIYICISTFEELQRFFKTILKGHQTSIGKEVTSQTFNFSAYPGVSRATTLSSQVVSLTNMVFLIASKISQ